MKPIHLAALTFALSVGTPAAAQERHTARIAVADLDLAGRAGRTRLDHRIADAIGRVCPGRHSTELRRRQEHRRCLAEATKQASSQRQRLLAAAAAPPRDDTFAAR